MAATSPQDAPQRSEPPKEPAGGSFLRRGRREETGVEDGSLARPQRQSRLCVGLAVHRLHLTVGPVFRWRRLFSPTLIAIVPPPQQVARQADADPRSHGCKQRSVAPFPRSSHGRLLDGDGPRYRRRLGFCHARRAVRGGGGGGVAVNISLSPYQPNFSSIPSTSAPCPPKWLPPPPASPHVLRLCPPN